MTKVSIIVPVYNAQDRIRKCIDSVLSQEYTDYELILVNDGSSDDTEKILNEYGSKDDRIVVVHKENSGPSDTRNMGISLAKGEYIQFLDADDWLTHDSTKVLVRQMEETGADMVVADFYRVVGNSVSRKGSIISNESMTLQEYAQNMMDSPADYYYGVLWNKLYKKDIIVEHDIKMDKELSFCEDFVFNLEYLLHCKTISPLQIPVYYYVKSDDSLVAQNLNVANIIKMKTSIYTYYDNFFKDILDEKQYAKDRIDIAKFLVSAATDEMTIPLLPGTKKLGSENVRLFYEDKGKPTPVELSYYIDKAFEKYLNSIALKYGLDVKDIKVFYALYKAESISSPKEISDFTGIPQTLILISLEKLVSHEFVDIKLPFKVSITDKSEELRNDVDVAISDLYKLIYKDFSEEDRKRNEEMILKMYDNVKGSLV